MIYGEYIGRDRALPLQIFCHFSRQDDWTGEGDEKVVNIDRTKAIGATPGYLSCWRIADISRMDEWEDYIRSMDPCATSPRGRRSMPLIFSALASTTNCY